MVMDVDYTRPPKFHEDGEFQDWQKRVAEWTETLKKAYEKGQDRQISTRFTLLGRVFYTEALKDAQRCLVYDSVARKEFDFDNDDDPIKLVLSIVNIVAVDAPISHVTRLIKSYQVVISYRREKNKKVLMFASRFPVLPEKHLRQTFASPSSQAGQVLSITFLNNACLDERKLMSAKFQLICLAQARAKKNGDEVDSHV